MLGDNVEVVALGNAVLGQDRVMDSPAELLQFLRAAAFVDIDSNEWQWCSFDSLSCHTIKVASAATRGDVGGAVKNDAGRSPFPKGDRPASYFP
jgi:hypothetical protein